MERSKRSYINLPISWIHRDNRWMSFFAQLHLNPELGFDAHSMELSPSWHKDNAARMRDNGLHCAAHLPFFGPLIGHGDAEARRAGTDILKKAAEIADIYDVDHLVGHPSFFAHADADNKETPEGCIGPKPGKRWLDNSVEGWESVLAVTDTPIYLENTHDTGPEAVLELLSALDGGDYHAQVGMCFDLGHWFSFAQGCDRRNLQQWLDQIEPRVEHLHLHDNAGHADQHQGLGQGLIPLHDFFTSLKERGLKPTFTLEPHDEVALTHSLYWLASDMVAGEWLNFAGHQGLQP